MADQPAVLRPTDALLDLKLFNLATKWYVENSEVFAFDRFNMSNDAFDSIFQLVIDANAIKP